MFSLPFSTGLLESHVVWDLLNHDPGTMDDEGVFYKSNRW